MAAVSTTETGGKLIPPPANFAGKANCPSFEAYQKMYQRSIQDPEGFWAEIAGGFVWKKKWDKVREYTFEGNVSIKWFIGGKTNISVNALDRHLEKRGRPDGASSGKATSPPNRASDLPGRCTPRCASSPTCSSRWASRRAIASACTCR